MTSSRQVPSDCENDQVPTHHDQFADTVYESEDKTVEELDLKSVEDADELKDKLKYQT